MSVLGLLPPYELDDIKAAYHDKGLRAHPDRGGDPVEFIRLKEAYDLAVEYVTFRGSRRAWVATQVELYVLREEVIAEVLRRGGRVEVERLDWVEKSWGDGFHLLAERVRHIFVHDMADGDDFLAFLVEHRLPCLLGLDVAGSRVSKLGLRCLAGYEVLRWLDVSGTDADGDTLRALLYSLPSLEWLNIRNTSVGWWARWRLRRARPRLQVVSEITPSVTPGNEPIDPRELTGL